MGEIQNRMRAARAYAGLSQPQLAKSLGMSEKTYKLTEAGTRPVRHMELDAIAKICGLPPEWFTGDFEKLSEESHPERPVTQLDLAEIQTAMDKLVKDVRALAEGQTQTPTVNPSQDRLH